MHFFGVAVFLALGAAVTSVKPTKQELYEALDTTQRIWTVRRSYERGAPNRKHSCVYAKKEDLNGDSYQFVQGFKNGSAWQNETLYGQLSDHTGEAVLTVRKNPSKGKESGVFLLQSLLQNRSSPAELSCSRESSGHNFVTMQCISSVHRASSVVIPHKAGVWKTRMLDHSAEPVVSARSRFNGMMLRGIYI
ncbi:uncharacterized protein LOC144109586 [Amblyomma americanum]